MNNELKLKPLVSRSAGKDEVTDLAESSARTPQIRFRAELAWQLDLAADVMFENRETLEKLSR